MKHQHLALRAVRTLACRLDRGPRRPPDAGTRNDSTFIWRFLHVLVSARRGLEPSGLGAIPFAVNCLAGHLLAAQLDVANGSSTCIAGTISDANAFLTSVGYAGPGSYTITASQRAQAISLEQTLDSYTNDSTSTSC
jgi:hypothetical protein